MKYILLLIITLYFYAAIRYHIGKELGHEYFIFVLNKAISWASATCLGFSIIKLNPPFPSKKTLGISAFILGLTHVILTLLLIFREFFPTYFSDKVISEEGYLVLFSGGLTITLMVFPLLASLFPSKYPKKLIKLGKFALLVNFSHPILIGIKNWWEPVYWPLLLPPITLLATLVYAFTLLVYWKQKRVSL
jgi:hypothetical protein